MERIVLYCNYQCKVFLDKIFSVFNTGVCPFFRFVFKFKKFEYSKMDTKYYLLISNIFPLSDSLELII